MLSIILTFIFSKVTGWTGLWSKDDTIVAWYASDRVTVPPSFVTVISPDGEQSPSIVHSVSGKRITRLLPSSSTLVVKSVPLIPIVAVGVWIIIFSLGTNPNFPVANLAVPDTKLIAILLLDGSGSK